MKPSLDEAEVSLPLTLVDKFCRSFEKACKEAGRMRPLPSLEDYLGQAPESARSEVLQWLLKVEWDYRLERGERPVKDEYLTRFLNNRGVVEAAWREKSGITGEEPRTPGHRFEAFTPEELSAKLPQFEVLELIGQGGMGAVYKARQRGLDRLVALKVLPPGINHEAEFAERFVREAKALARLDHPNIAAIHDSGERDGLYYLVMEYVDGGNLCQFVKNRILPSEVLAIVTQICDALQFAHDTGVVHRDIKPGNILIDRDRRVKIADFGLAKLLGKDSFDDSLTGTNQVMGSLGYMSPEQMEGARNVDHRADIYSLGVVFYELLTGERPGICSPPPSKKAQIDPRLDEVVLRALERDREGRYQQVSELRTELETIRRRPDKSTLTSQFLAILDEGPSPPRISSFLSRYPALLATALGHFGIFTPDTHVYCVGPDLGDTHPGLSVGTVSSTRGDWEWLHFFFCPSDGPLFDGQFPHCDLKQALEKLDQLTTWLSAHPRQAIQVLLPDKRDRSFPLRRGIIDHGHNGIILANRRGCLSDLDREGIRRLKHNGILVRSYDWILDAIPRVTANDQRVFHPEWKFEDRDQEVGQNDHASEPNDLRG